MHSTGYVLVNIIAKPYFHMAGLDDESPTRQGWSKRSGASPKAGEKAFDS
jgi:hypothetical protein